MSASWVTQYNGPSWMYGAEVTVSQPCNYFPISRGKTVQISIQVINMMKRLLKAKIPTCLAESFKEKVFEACVESIFASLSDVERDEVLLDIGCFPGRRPPSIIEEAASTLNAPRVVRALVLGQLLGIRPENLFNTFPIDLSTYCNYRVKRI